MSNRCIGVCGQNFVLVLGIAGKVLDFCNSKVAVEHISSAVNLIRTVGLLDKLPFGLQTPHTHTRAHEEVFGFCEVIRAVGQVVCCHGLSCVGLPGCITGASDL